MNKIRKPTFAMLLNPVHFISMGYGSGLSPFAPGTVGTLAAIPLYLLCMQYIGGIFENPVQFTLLVTIMFIIGCVCAHFTGKALGVTDHGAIVWDEVVGYFVTVSVIPYSQLSIMELIIWTLVGFFVFRFFDIFKPWPASWVDKNIKNGFGVMLDDVLAAIISALVLYAGLLVFGGYNV